MNSSFGLLQGQGEAARTSESETSVVEPEHSLHEVKFDTGKYAWGGTVHV